jgi:hypothetical protein
LITPPGARVKSIRGGSGLGDAIYLQSVARHFVERGQRLRVHSAWPDVFRPLGDRVTVAPFRRDGIDILAHYSLRKGRGTNQFEDCCIQAGLKPPFDLRLDWALTDVSLVANLLAKADGRKILLVQLPRSPMGRTDGFGAELLPDCHVIQYAIDRLRERAMVVQIGSGEPVFRFSGIEVDLANQTTVSQLLDVGFAADAFLGYCSFIIPLAESFSKPALLVWSARGLRADRVFVRQITPKKVLFRPSSKHVIDDWNGSRIEEVVDAFMR